MELDVVDCELLELDDELDELEVVVVSPPTTSQNPSAISLEASVIVFLTKLRDFSRKLGWRLHKLAILF